MLFPAEMNGYILIALAGGIFFIIYGLLNIFGKRLMWRLRSRFSFTRLKASQRTPDWNRRTTASGLFFMMVGMLGLLFALLIPQVLSSLQPALP